ncbi:MAG: HAD family hydrolase [Eubacteriales bacterium]
MYQAIIFDLDGTLLNTIPDLETAGNHTLTTLGAPTRTTAEFQSMVGNGIPNLVERMLPNDTGNSQLYNVALSEFLSYYEKHSDDQTRPYHGILELLTTLRESGYELGVLTNKEDSLAQDVVQSFFPNLFTIIHGARKSMASKPDPAGLYHICEQLHLKTSQVLYVGDSEVDMHTAKNAQVDCCAVLWGYRTLEQLQAVGASTFIEEPSELLSLLK